MKKISFFAVALFLLMSFESYSQNFQFYRISPPIVQGDTSSMYATVTKGILINTASTTQLFKYVRVLNNLPAGWISQR